MSNGQHSIATAQIGIAADAPDVSKLIPLFWEIGNLKRVRAAHLAGSVAENLFRQAWMQIAAGADVRQTALRIAADAVVAAQLGAIDRDVLRSAELSEAETKEIFKRGFDFACALDENQKNELWQALDTVLDLKSEKTLQFVEMLARQPRSGATKIGAPRLIFDQPENHAEHCLSVGVCAVLLAPVFAADVETVFLCALAHHFHNARLPDAGFAGEEMLGAQLPKVFSAFREKCLQELPVGLGEKIRKTFVLIETADSPEARAFHAADVIDRVLQMRHHAAVAEFTLQRAMEEMELVHAGAIQTFHYEILRAAELI